MHPYNLRVENRHSATITRPKNNRRSASSANTYSLNRRTQTQINYTLGLSKKAQLDIKCIVEHLSKRNVLYVSDFGSDANTNETCNKAKEPKELF